MNNEIVIYRSERKSLFVIFGSLLLVAAGYLFLHNTNKEVIGWSIIILSVLCLIFGIGSLFDRKPQLILTKDGITEMNSVREEIEWNAIHQVDEFFYRGQNFIRFLVNRNYKPESIQPK
ncbi:MAG: hypothetical protein LUG18_10665 [Candidatus Azobacteroides sp.]|nr:hypothetical protein [Candidatus Azobacteroides sp.]